MAATVVAKQTIQMRYAQEAGRDEHCLGIPNILLRTTSDHSANNEIQIALRVAIGSSRCDQLCRHLIVGLVGSKRITNPFLESGNTLGVARNL